MAIPELLHVVCVRFIKEPFLASTKGKRMIYRSIYEKMKKLVIRKQGLTA